MSHDGSSAKSYIRHPTEKERLDNLAFTSFPEDYLPYAGHNRTVPPPYLLWGEDRRRRSSKRKRNPKCAGALLCAIILVVIAIVAVVAISVYLGVVTNLFRSPVVSLSGRFIASEEFSEELQNATSSQFLEKAEAYQSKIEKAFLSSSLEPAFIAARIYSFKPGLEIFFRVYLDRRKLSQEDESTEPKELVRDVIAAKLAQNPNSVVVEENEDFLLGEAGFAEDSKVKATKSPNSKLTTQPPNFLLPTSEGVGAWHPVPIEDTVSPSFGDGSSQTRVKSESSPTDTKKRTSTVGGSVKASEEVQKVQKPSEKPQETAPASNQEVGRGSVRFANPRNPLLRATSSTPESTGSVLIQEKRPTTKIPKLTSGKAEGVGSVHLLSDSPVLPENTGVGSVRLLDETPIRNPRPLGAPKISESLSSAGPKGLRRLPSNTKASNAMHGMEMPPTLSPSVVLVVRNKTKSTDKLLNLTVKSDKSEEAEGFGLAAVREVDTDADQIPWMPFRKSDGKNSRLLDSVTESSYNFPPSNQSIMYAENITENPILLKDASESYSTAQSDLVKTNKSDAPAPVEENKELLENDTDTRNLIRTTADNFQNFNGDTKPTLGTFLFSQPSYQSSVIYNDYINEDLHSSTGTETTLENNTNQTLPDELLDAEASTVTSIIYKFNTTTKEAISSVEDTSDYSDISSTMENSPYFNANSHIEIVEKDLNVSSTASYDAHTSKGHGFHKPIVIPKPLNDSEAFTEKVTTHEKQDNTFDDNHQNISTKEFVTDSTYPEQFYTTQEELFNDTYMNDSEISKYNNHENLELENSEKQSQESSSEIQNVTTEDNSQQAKVVPQLQSQLLSNDIDEKDGFTDDLETYPEGIMQHFTTVTYTENDTGDQSCPPGMLPCSASPRLCGLRCDMKRDCPNNEDEHGCSCSDYLRAMGQTQKVCDGVADCSDGSDESDCSWCPSTDYFRCPGSRTCITQDKVCDSKEDCPGAQDEKHCVSLADSSQQAKSLEYQPKGYLLLRRNGRWGKLCLDSLAHSPDLDQKTQELGQAVCTALTYRNMSSSVRTVDHIESENSYYQISTANPYNRSVSALFEPSPCEKKQVLRVKCESLECGLRPSAPPTQRRRIVGGKSAEGAGAWPWAAALYREGDFQCGAALVSEHWLISAAHCFYSSLGAHWVARLGVLRRGSELLSGWEQVRPIQDIILHPEYEDIGFINDIALLKMEKPVPFSDFLRPICLPSSASEDASLWHGRRCAVIGWGKLYEIGHTFPDSLQEVFLPVISSADCQRRSIFMPAYRITPKMFCAGYERGGRDACLGDSGGPMACQRPTDSRWVLLGVTSNGDGCGRPNRPGVYTQVAGYLSWLQETMNQKDFARRTGTESTCPAGVRCHLGRCIHQARVCDGKRDCAAGEDEESC